MNGNRQEEELWLSLSLVIRGQENQRLLKELQGEMDINYLPFDSLISTLEKLYPETGMKHLDDNRMFSRKLAAFVDEWIGHITYEEVDVVIDLYQLFPRDYASLRNKRETEILYVGSPQLSCEEKLEDLRRYERERDWTKNVNDEAMKKILGDFLGEGVQMAEQCAELAIPFVDTSHRFDEAIEESVRFLRRRIESRRL